MGMSASAKRKAFTILLAVDNKLTVFRSARRRVEDSRLGHAYVSLRPRLPTKGELKAMAMKRRARETRERTRIEASDNDQKRMAKCSKAR